MQSRMMMATISYSDHSSNGSISGGEEDEEDEGQQEEQRMIDNEADLLSSSIILSPKPQHQQQHYASTSKAMIIEQQQQQPQQVVEQHPPHRIYHPSQPQYAHHPHPHPHPHPRHGHSHSSLYDYHNHHHSHHHQQQHVMHPSSAPSHHQITPQQQGSFYSQPSPRGPPQPHVLPHYNHQHHQHHQPHYPAMTMTAPAPTAPHNIVSSSYFSPRIPYSPMKQDEEDREIVSLPETCPLFPPMTGSSHGGLEEREEGDSDEEEEEHEQVNEQEEEEEGDLEPEVVVSGWIAEQTQQLPLRYRPAKYNTCGANKMSLAVPSVPKFLAQVGPRAARDAARASSAPRSPLSSNKSGSVKYPKNHKEEEQASSAALAQPQPSLREVVRGGLLHLTCQERPNDAEQMKRILSKDANAISRPVDLRELTRRVCQSGIHSGQTCLPPAKKKRRTSKEVTSMSASTTTTKRRPGACSYRLPLNVAIACGARAPALRILLEVAIAAGRAHVLDEPDGGSRGECTLQVALKHGVPAALVGEMLEARPGAARHLDGHGNTPLHVLCATAAASATENNAEDDKHNGLARRLLELHPEAARARNFHGYTPLQVLQRRQCSSSWGDRAESCLLDLLVSHESGQSRRK